MSFPVRSHRTEGLWEVLRQSARDGELAAVPRGCEQHGLSTPLCGCLLGFVWWVCLREAFVPLSAS